MTKLFRAVDSDEMEQLRSTGSWSSSPNGAAGKGFFYDRESAEQFGAQQSAMGGALTVVVVSTAPNEVVEGSYQQSAATEGKAVFIEIRISRGLSHRCHANYDKSTLSLRHRNERGSREKPALRGEAPA